MTWGNITTERWTGRWDKKLDTTTNLIEMGARPYDPALGRFLAVDPVDGGSCNVYDYSCQDPVNVYDLDGTFCSRCKKLASKAAGWSAGKSVDVAGALVLGVNRIERGTVVIYKGGTASVAVTVRTLGPSATVFFGGFGTAAGQAASDAFVKDLSARARVGRAVVAGIVGATAVGAGGVAALACGACGVVVTLTLNYAGQKYVASYVDRRFGLVPSRR